SAAPIGMIRTFEEKYQIPFFHAHGATETTPLATYSRLKSYQQDLPVEEKIIERTRQGILVPGLEMKIVGEEGEVPWDDKTMVELLTKRPWIDKENDKDGRYEKDIIDGWFHRCDVVTLDREGTMNIFDRTADLIKSGGEWISSVKLENIIMAHEDVFAATII